MDTIWLGELEEKVRAVGEELEKLRKDNEQLVRKNQQLEKQAGRKRTGSNAQDSPQLDEVKRRVEGLVDGLESLLEGSA